MGLSPVATILARGRWALLLGRDGGQAQRSDEVHLAESYVDYFALFTASLGRFRESQVRNHEYSLTLCKGVQT